MKHRDLIKFLYLDGFAAGLDAAAGVIADAKISRETATEKIRETAQTMREDAAQLAARSENRVS